MPDDGLEPDAPTPRRQAITRQLVIDKALEVVDEFGVEGLTMRRLGSALGADPMAAYQHVRNKAELVDAIVEHVAAEVARLPPVDAAGDPLEQLVALAVHYRTVLLRHPILAPLVASRPLPQAGAPELLVVSVDILRAIGFEDEDVPFALDALVTFGYGFVLQEAGRIRNRDAFGVPYREQQADVLRRLAELPGDTELAQAVVVQRLAEDSSARHFEVGIRALLHGLRSGLGRRPT